MNKKNTRLNKRLEILGQTARVNYILSHTLQKIEIRGIKLPINRIDKKLRGSLPLQSLKEYTKTEGPFIRRGYPHENSQSKIEIEKR